MRRTGGRRKCIGTRRAELAHYPGIVSTLGDGTVREVSFALLRQLGLTTVFGNPGSTEMPMLRDFPDDFTYVLGLQEGAVLSMAEGYAKGTGGAVLVNLHTAPGLGNAMGAMVTAFQGRAPLVVTAGQQDRRQLASEPFLSGKLVELAAPYVKWAHEPARAEDVPAALERAYHTALQAPRGPVFVSVPMDDWDAQVPAHAAREVSYRSAPDPAAMRRVAELLRSSRRPAIVAGADHDRAGEGGSLQALAERLGAAVWAEPFAGEASFPQDHPLFQGHLAPAQKPLGEQLAAYDLVLVVGAPVFAYYPYVPGPTVAPGTQVVQLTADPAEAARALTGSSVVGDVGLGLEALLDELPHERRAGPPLRPAPELPRRADPMPVAWVLHELSERMPDGAILVEEAPSTKGDLHTHVRIGRAGTYHTTASGGLGYALPAAVGLKLARPDTAVVCVVGEGSAMYTPQAIWTAVRHGAAVCFVVLNNSHYGILKSFGDLLGTDGVPGLDVPGIDVISLARGFGCGGERVAHSQELAQALERALSADAPYVLDVVIDPAITQLV